MVRLSQDGVEHHAHHRLLANGQPHTDAAEREAVHKVGGACGQGGSEDRVDGERGSKARAEGSDAHQGSRAVGRCVHHLRVPMHSTAWRRASLSSRPDAAGATQLGCGWTHGRHTCPLAPAPWGAAGPGAGRKERKKEYATTLRTIHWVTHPGGGISQLFCEPLQHHQRRQPWQLNTVGSSSHQRGTALLELVPLQRSGGEDSTLSAATAALRW